MKDLYVVIERDEDGFYVGEVLQLRACYSQGRTIDELLHNIREVIALCLDDPSASQDWPEFIDEWITQANLSYSYPNM